MSINTTFNYSPNFDLKKRKLSKIKFIIFHYTGMKSEKEAIDHLINERSRVSSHYLIKKNGEIITLVPDLYVAWHAGKSSWGNYKFLNKYSIGIEISNSGHDFKYKKYSRKQINSILKLSKYLINKYKIKSKFILGHSDVAPERKKDPGEKFPWKYFSENKIGFWHNLNEKKLIKERNKVIGKIDQINFIKNLTKIGYPTNLGNKKIINLKMLTKAFQRRFRQELINGIIDKECLIISNNLYKNIDNFS